MNKKILTILISVVVIIGAIIAVVMINKEDQNQQAEIKQETQLSEKVTDECTEEYEEEQEEIEKVNSEEEKISPNGLMILEKHYQTCGHTIREYVELPPELINQTKEGLQEEYVDWSIKNFTSNEVTLSKEESGECGEHYVLKEKDGKIIIYQIAEDGKEEEFEQTSISTEYLTESDMQNIKQGIRVNGREELNKTLEDFE